jgi:hypothetical protein
MAYCLYFYTYCSPLGVGCYLYADVKRTTTIGAGWVADGNTNWAVNSSGMITGIADCNVTSPDWTLSFGEYTCVGCNKHYVEVDNNPYSPTYGNTRTAGVAESNSTYCGGCCGQSTAADWTIIFGSYGCSGCDKYYMEYDANPCSPTYNQERVSSALAESNSTYCCSAPTCYFYQMNDSGWVAYTDCYGTARYQFFEWYDGFCASQLSSGNAYQSQTCLY